MINLQSPKERELNEKINFLQTERELVRAQKTITCPSCKKRTQLRKATVIREHHYIRPYSCSGGDYWTFSEYNFYCNKCDSFNRAYTGSFDKEWQDDKKFKPEALKETRVQLYLLIKEYISYFGEVLDNYDDNLTITQLRKKNKERKEQRDLY
jgi:hypothetical protein